MSKKRIEVFASLVAAIENKATATLVCNRSREVASEELPLIHVVQVSEHKEASNQTHEKRGLIVNVEIYAIGKNKDLDTSKLEDAVNEALLTGTAQQFGCIGIKGGDADFTNEDAWYENCQVTLSYTLTYSNPAPWAKRK